MMPNQQAQGQPPQMSQQEAKQALTQVLRNARKLAEEYQIDFDSLVAATGSSQQMPRPPSVPSM